MKEIFDWLREQINKTIYSIQLQNNHGVNFKAIDIVDAENIIAEAEAKWKEDCKRADFEHRINEVLPMLEEKQLYGTASLIKDLAYVLGIKIAEVE